MPAAAVTELHPDGRTRDIVPRGLDGPYGVTIDLGGTVHAAGHYRVASPEPPGEGTGGDVTTFALLTFAHGIAADGDLLHLTSQYGTVVTYDPARRSSRTRATGLRPAPRHRGRTGRLPRRRGDGGGPGR